MFVLAVSAVASIASAQIHGAIYDTDITGLIVNENNYDSCFDVYLNGGPQNESSQGLPPGDYFYMVTNPSGSVKLSGDDVRNRRLRVGSNGRIIGPVPDPIDGVTYPGHVASAGPQYAPTWDPDHNVDAFPNNLNGSTGVHLWPFAESPNGGGVYKVWLIPVGEYDADNANNSQEQFGFKSANQKTDNFKCVHGDGEIPPSSFIFGAKFYDLDHDGTRDPGEPVLAGWEIRIKGRLGNEDVDYSTFTDVNGEYSAELDEGSTFEICEVIPVADPAWTQSHPSNDEFSPGGDAQADETQCWEGEVGAGDIQGLDFGNFRAVTFSGHKFYDENFNGMDDDGDQVVAGIRINVYIVDPEGNESLYDPADPDQGFTTVTDVDGNWTVTLDYYGLDGYTFRIEEVVPGTSDPNCAWVQTYPATGSHTVDNSATGLNFGNVCFCYPSEGRTLGFWSNRNGQRILSNNDEAWRTLLNGYTLRKADGSDFDVVLGGSFNNAYGPFRTWLLNGTAENMSYMLSVQLAASLLNDAFNGLDATQELILPDHLDDCGFGSTVRLVEVYAEAEASLAADFDGQALAGDDNREYQECLKTILDMSNNNQLPTGSHDGPCDVVYP